MSGIVNKAKEAVDKVVHPEHHKTGAGSTNAGAHNSNLANKADPRIDSDRDGSRNAGAAVGNDGIPATGPGLTSVGAGGHTTTGGVGSTTGGVGTTHHTSTNAGPHSSNLANKADPRIDSDLDGSRNFGASPGYGAGHSVAGGHGSTTAGPHDSNLANKADPRVDSDLDGSRRIGAGTTGGHSGAGTTGGLGNAGTTGGYSGAGTTGPGGVRGVAASGLGPAPNTAGPHNSDLLNKADPRVDSDLDGSKTVGGNKTY